MRVRGSGSESGSVLLWVMVVGLFAVGALGAATRLIPAGTRFTAQDADTTYALIAAESGVHYVMHYLDKHGPDALETLTGEWNAPGELGGTYRVVSDGEFVYVTGQFGNATRSLRARLTGELRGMDVERDTRLQLDVAAYALANIPLGGNGAFLDLAGGAHVYGSAGTNSVQRAAVKLVGGAQIDGDIIVGPVPLAQARSVVSTPDWMTLNGDIIPNPPRDYPLPVFPEPFPELRARGSIVLRGTGGLEVIVDEPGYYDLISVGSGANTIIFDTHGNDLHVRVKEFEVSGNGRVEVRGGGRLFLYVDQVLKLADKHFNSEGDAMSAAIYYAGMTRLTLAGGFNFRGVIYAKDADVHIAGSFGPEAWIFTGGREVTLAGGANLGTNGIIYAPFADVKVAGGASTGIVIGNSVTAAGGAQITHHSLDANSLPILFPHELNEDLPDTLHWHVCWTDCLSEVQADEP